MPTLQIANRRDKGVMSCLVGYLLSLSALVEMYVIIQLKYILESHVVECSRESFIHTEFSPGTVPLVTPEHTFLTV